MVLIFDLDNTLYDEMTFVSGGFRAVARYGKQAFNWDEKESYSFMMRHLSKHGRGEVFNEWLRLHDRYSLSSVARCVNVYRRHQPEISLFPAARRVLDFYRGQYPLYLVTDGNKKVQEKKIEALNIESVFNRVFITHRYGICHAKPSLYCFERIRLTEQCSWSQIVYVGDNPAKDFVSLNAMGALTVRVTTGAHASDVAPPSYDASVTIPNLCSLRGALKRWKNGFLEGINNQKA
jgi:putative hydrolase of the HAD superfamily